MAESKPNKSKIDYRLTLAGGLFLLGFLLIALAAVRTQRALLFVIFGLMLGALLLSLLVSRRMLLAVTVQRDLPRRTFAQRLVYLAYALRHRGRRGAVVGLEVSELRPPPRLEVVGSYCLFLPAGGSFRSGSRFMVHQRGRYELPALRLSTRFPFSLLHARRDLAQADQLVVWPALGALQADLMLRGAAEVSDAAPSLIHSGSDEFFGLREYRQGDNPRWIHWKRSAATGQPVVREMAKPRPDVMYVVLDTQLEDEDHGRDAHETHGQDAHATREKLIRFAATLIDYAFRREYGVGLALAYRDKVVALPAAVGRGHRSVLLDALADVDDNRHRPLSATLSAVPRHLLQQAHLVLVGPSRERMDSLSVLRQICRHTTVVTLDNLSQFYRDDPQAAAAAQVGDG